MTIDDTGCWKIYDVAQFPTGTMRGRFRPEDGQLYLCGMFAWAGNQQRPGGFYRVRYTGEHAYLPVGLKAKKAGMEITFSDELDIDKISPKDFRIKTWSLKRTRNYGSKHYDEKGIEVSEVKFSADRGNKSRSTGGSGAGEIP